MKWHSNTSRDRLKRYKEEMKIREEIAKLYQDSNKLDWVEQAAKEAKRVR